MIIGIGIDLIEVDRVEQMIARHPGRARERLFTDEEAAYCDGSGTPGASYAARFAAKEGLFKALGTGWGSGASWKEVEITMDDLGAPRMRLCGETLRLAQSRGFRTVHVSLTHTRNLAGAFVVLEGGTD